MTMEATALVDVDPRVAQRDRLFWTMWGIAHIFHLWLLHSGALSSVPAWATMLAALALVRWPGHRWLPGILAVAQLADVAYEAPEVADHWALVAAANVVVLLLYATGRRGPGLIHQAAPVFRTLLLIAYSAAALSKWNTAFLDPVHSCAAYLGSVATLGASSLIPGAATAQVIGTVAIESSIPILLIIPRTRRFGARLGIVFHFIVSLSPRIGVEDFTATLFAFFILFIPCAELDKGMEIVRRLSAKSDIARAVRAHPERASLLLLGCAGLLGFVDANLSKSVLWAVATIFGALVVIGALASLGVRGALRRWGRPPAYLLLIPLLLVLYAASPYVGGRTTGVFTMFSNLRTETNANHLFLPDTDLLGYHSDLVKVTGISDPEMQGLVDEGLSVPEVQVAALVEAADDLVIEGRLDGQVVVYGAATDSKVVDPLTWLESRWLQFRPIQADAAQLCSV